MPYYLVCHSSDFDVMNEYSWSLVSPGRTHASTIDSDD
jgi:hypothetical protein